MSQDLLFRLMGDRWLRLAALLLVLAALAHQISLVVWHHFPTPGQMVETKRSPAPRNPATGQSATNYLQQANAISRVFLFGKPEAQAVAVERIEEAPETKLNYKLRGIYYSPEPRLSSAIVEVQPNKSRHFLLEDELGENITLARIEQDHILINRYGKLERLNLQKPKPATRSTPARPSSGSANAATLLRTYKQRYTNNPMALATRFQAIPVQQDGKNIGFKLKALRGETILKKLNFEPNDVFTSINGVSLKNPLDAVDALRSLTTANSISVTFMRNGAERTLNFRL